jgi:putative tryptophan/tyrosine transport system substrate-binding protein
MDRRGIVLMLSALAALPPALHAQQPTRVRRIGWLSLDSETTVATKIFLAAFRAGMGELKWVEGRDYAIDVRYANGSQQVVPGLADELVASRPDLLIGPGDSSARVLMQKTKTIPIVFAISVDPVGNGLVESLARPGGNVTGMTNQVRELGPKRLQLLKEVFPRVAHVGVLYEPNEVSSADQAKTVESAAKTLGLRTTLIELRQVSDIQPAVARGASQGIDAYLPVASPLTVAHGQAIVEYVNRSKLPAIYTVARFADVGGLMSYGPDIPDNFRRAAGFVDKILKGANPADLPTQQPTKFELVVNLKTAAAMGFNVPQSVLLRADRVVE